MFNRKSSYALNKKDPNAIVYMDANEAIIRLTREDFASEEEFLKWKSWSDGNYHTEDNQDVVEGKHNTSMQPTPNETQIHTDELVDIREVSVDKNLPKEERIAAFIRQIKNPYRFRCGDFVVNACFAGNGVTLEECLQGILR